MLLAVAAVPTPFPSAPFPLPCFIDSGVHADEAPEARVARMERIINNTVTAAVVAKKAGDAARALDKAKVCLRFIFVVGVILCCRPGSDASLPKLPHPVCVSCRLPLRKSVA